MMKTINNSPQPRVRLTEARILRHWSQHEVADLIGTTHVNVSRWERGMTRPSPYFRRKLCALFNKSEEELDLKPMSEAPVDTSIDILTITSREAAVKALYDPAIPLRPATRLVGRDAELSQLKARLSKGGSVALTALNGLPGVGKTALSIALAHDEEIRVRFCDGVLWAGLGPNPNIPGVLSRWGTLLGLSSATMLTHNSIEEWTMSLHTAIGSRSMLLVIDDAWTTEDALTFKVGGPNCAHLLTTRFPSVATEITFDGATLLSELSEEESMALLHQLAPDVVRREEKRAAELVHAVGGLPLALTLMGNYLRKQSYSKQSRRITTALERLSKAEERLKISEPHGPVESHTSLSIDTHLSLQSVFDVTDQQLDEQARAALYALSVFPPKPNSFSEEAALAVAACTLDTLDTLTDTGLLEINRADRYTLHQTIADYARMHLTETAAQDRLIAYAITYIKEHKKDYELLERESNIILAALETAHALERRAELVRGAIAFAPFLLLRGLYSQAEQHLHRAHEAAVALEDQDGLSGALLYLGELAQKQGNYAQAEDYLQKGLAIARQLKDGKRICDLLNNLGAVAWKRGDYAQSETYLQEGLTLARQMQDRERICALLSDLGGVAWRQGEYTQAEIYLQEGLTLARQIDDRERLCNILKILGLVAASEGNYAQEEMYLQEGLSLARQIGDREQQCIMLMNLGVTAGEQGNYTQAEAHFQEGLILARQIGHSEWISALLSNLGNALSERENYTQAEMYLQEGLVLVRQTGNNEWASILLVNLGLTSQKQGNHTQAEVHLQEALALAQQLKVPQIIANALYEYGNLHLNRRQLEAAEANFREMLTTIREGDQELIALAQYGLARVVAGQGDFGEASRLGEMSLTSLKEIGNRKVPEVENWLASLGNF